MGSRVRGPFALRAKQRGGGAGVPVRGLPIATWFIEQEGEEVVLTYQEGSVRTPCGRGDVVLLPYLYEWVVQQAQPLDLVSMNGATFVRQANRPSAVLPS